MPDPAMLNPGLPGAAVPPPMPTPMPPGMIPQDINPPGHVPGGLQPGVPVTDPFAAPNVSHPGAGFPIAPEPQQPGAGFPGGYPAVSPSGGLDAAIPPMAEAVPPPFAPPAATPFAPPAATPFAPPAAATPLGASNPFEEAAGRHVADDAAFDPLAVTTRQAPVSADAAAPMPPSVAGGAPPAAMPSSPATAPAPATGGADARAAFRAFLEGAGMADGQVDDADPEASLRLAGAVFKAMTEGLREILISRAAIKSEMRIEATMISAQGNNPLKFSVAPEDAVAAMLTQKRRGYMAPVAAAREAVADIKDHEIAVMAGVQTALMHLLKRFNPDELEKRLSLGGLSAVLPGARKSRYWDSFRQIYGDITREAEDDFQAVFGRNFAKAYTEQSRKD
jgi:type VI secretion system protein